MLRSMIIMRGSAMRRVLTADQRARILGRKADRAKGERAAASIDFWRDYKRQEQEKRKVSDVSGPSKGGRGLK